MFFSNINFANIEFLGLLIFVPLMIFWQWRKYRRQFPELKMSSLAAFKGRTSLKARLRPLLFFFKIAAFTCLVIALARPQNTFDEKKVTADGIDIVMVMDVSGSMLARDFEPDRLGASKNVAAEFIEAREHDRIGLVVFAGESFTQCPVTTDKSVLKTQLSQIKSGIIEDGTAIGMGLATAVDRLKESEAKSKVVILLTDGVNNSGFIDPMTAAEIAKKFKVKTYTIGVGTKGMAPYPVNSFFGTRYQQMKVEIDEKLLEEIATMTNGKYFRATDNNSLKKVYEQIDELEKTKIVTSTVSQYTEKFHLFALLAAIFLALELFLRNTFFRGIT